MRTDTASRADAAGDHRADIVAVGHAPVLRVNRAIYRALHRIGWKVELVVPDRLPWNPDPASVEPDGPDDPPIHRLAPQGSYIRTWSFQGLIELLAARRPRLVYLENEPDSRMAWLIGGWCAGNGAKLVVNTNENDIPTIAEACRRGLKPALRSLRTRLWASFAGSRVSHVVAICEDGRRAMEAIGFDGAVTVAPLGFDRGLFHPDAARRAATRQRLGLDRPVIAYFGRLAPNKGVHLLIAALGRIKDQDWLFLADDLSHAPGEYAARLRRAVAEADIADRTIAFEARHEEMPDYMRATDIVAVPSTWKEQYGRVAPEAMACGCAVVVSDIGALPELVGPAGLRVPPGDVEALATTLSDLLADPGRRRRMGEAAVERAHALLSIDRQAVVLDQLFRRLRGEVRS